MSEHRYRVMDLNEAIRIVRLAASHEEARPSVGTLRMVASAAAEVESLRAAVERVRGLHAPSRPTDLYPSCVECTHGCGTGDVDYPCPTLRALDGET